MDLIVDANILFSALIKNGLTVEILFDDNLKLHAPEFILTEFIKHEKLILEKTKRTKESFNEIWEILYEIIDIIPESEYINFIKEAEKISPDFNDSPYFALALKLDCAIWSNDKELKKQDLINVYSTEELISLQKGK